MFRGTSSRNESINNWLGNCPHKHKRQVTIPIYEDDVNLLGAYVGAWIVWDCTDCGAEVSRERSG